MSTRKDAQSKALSKDPVAKDGQSAKPAPQKSKQLGRSASKPPTKTKTNLVLNQLHRAKGATITQLMASTGWQAHSLRAVICGLRKQGISIDRSKAKNGITVYRAEKP
jgi:Protein of unknown function (DUF3489)